MKPGTYYEIYLSEIFPLYYLQFLLEFIIPGLISFEDVLKHRHLDTAFYMSVHLK